MVNTLIQVHRFFEVNETVSLLALTKLQKKKLQRASPQFKKQDDDNEIDFVSRISFLE